MESTEHRSSSANIDPDTVAGFGREWSAYDQSGFLGPSYDEAVAAYFGLLPFDRLASAEGFDLGCGSGRWAAAVAPRVGLLHCIDPSPEALAVARRRLAGVSNARFHLASANTIPLEDSSQDFGYSLGVLHHIPDMPQALRACVKKLKPGAPFLLYIYYRMENRPAWYRLIWRLTDFARQGISRLSFPVRKFVTSAIAALVYWPLSRGARAMERLGFDPSQVPLSGYRHCSFYTMRTDALDRFGTRLEQRYSRAEIQQMMECAGLRQIRFREGAPYWIACGVRRGAGHSARADS